MDIDVQHVTKRFGRFAALADVSLHVGGGELVALLGPSGGGKTTLLRVIAGLEAPDAGAVLLDGRDTTRASLRDRNVGFVFQHYALFRHMTVFENIAFGLRVRPRRHRPPEAEIRARVERLLALIQLETLADRLPSQLSGGQRQRVALARALAVEPRVLLLDEPFGALDAKVRKGLRRWLRRLHDDLHVTSVFVTHDQEEALELADQVAILNAGRLEQVGSPGEVYEKPASPFVYDFLGDVNLFHGRIDNGRLRLGALDVLLPPEAAGNNGAARIYVRPHLLTVDRQPGSAPEFRARVVHVNPAGPLVRIELQAAWGEPFRVEVAQDRYEATPLERGHQVYVRFAADDLYVAPE